MPQAHAVAPRPSMSQAGELNRYDFLYSNQSTLAGSAIGQMEIKTQQDSIFVVQSLMAISTGKFSARILDDGTGSNWQNQPIFVENTYGSAQLPNILIHPIIVYPTSSILIELTNNTALSNVIEIVLGGYKIFKASERPTGKRNDLWFQYAARTTVAGNNTDSTTIKIQADSWFEVQKIVAVGLTAAFAPANFSARLSDSGLGKAWSDRFIQRDDQFGTARFPRVLPFPKLIRPNSTVQVELTDLSGVSNTIEVVLEGVKKYSL